MHTWLTQYLYQPLFYRFEELVFGIQRIHQLEEGYPKMLLEILADVGGYIRSRERHTDIPMKLYICEPTLFDDDSDEEMDVPRHIWKHELLYGVRTRDGGVLSKDKRRTNYVNEDDVKKH